ncbi:MAG: hypothetical protein DBX52_01610 [Clostridiales bacterium]|nr:MAG: hypothetical protein DBX52_01610 [Clostridiales bacterium]
MMSKLQNPEVDHLFQAVLSLQTLEECYSFFEDACTIKEIQEIAQRFEVACQLEAGKNYLEVNRNTGASTATICRVNKCLHYGKDGYKTVIQRLKPKGGTEQ